LEWRAKETTTTTYLVVVELKLHERIVGQLLQHARGHLDEVVERRESAEKGGGLVGGQGEEAVPRRGSKGGGEEERGGGANLVHAVVAEVQPARAAGLIQLAIDGVPHPSLFFSSLS
jgi:hypothetical protein